MIDLYATYSPRFAAFLARQMLDMPESVSSHDALHLLLGCPL
jgi:hypothetical protein